jgi:hypothetical protein
LASGNDLRLAKSFGVGSREPNVDDKKEQLISDDKTSQNKEQDLEAIKEEKSEGKPTITYSQQVFEEKILPKCIDPKYLSYFVMV